MHMLKQSFMEKLLSNRDWKRWPGETMKTFETSLWAGGRHNILSKLMDMIVALLLLRMHDNKSQTLIWGAVKFQACHD